MVDDSPVRQGMFTPGSHVEIKPRAALAPEDELLIFAWSYMKEIYPKVKGHRMLAPLPDVRWMQ